MTATQSAKAVWSLHVSLLQSPADLVIEESELLEEFVSFETTGRYSAIEGVAFFLEIMSRCGPFSADSRAGCPWNQNCSPNILQGQANPNLSIASQSLSTKVKKNKQKKAGKDKMFETGNAPDCLSRSLKRVIVVVVVVVVEGQLRLESLGTIAVSYINKNNNNRRREREWGMWNDHSKERDVRRGL